MIKKIKYLTLVILLSSSMTFTACSPQERALVGGLALGTIVAATLVNGSRTNATTSVRTTRYNDDRPYYYSGNRYYYGGYYRNGYYHHNGRKYNNGRYYRGSNRYDNGRRYKSTRGTRTTRSTRDTRSNRDTRNSRRDKRTDSRDRDYR